MKTKTLRRLVSVLAALVMAVSLLAGCGAKTAEQVQEQEDAQTIQVYLWSTSLYETYAPYVQSQLSDVNIEFIVGNNDLDFYKFLQENGGLPDIITCCRFSLHDAAPLKDSLMNLAMTNEAGAVYNLSLIHISEPTRRTPISYAVFCLKKKRRRDVYYTHLRTQETDINIE